MDLRGVIIFSVCAAALSNQCSSASDETCLLQVKSDMKLGKDRQGSEAGVSASYECWPNCAPKCPEACGSMAGYFTEPTGPTPAPVVVKEVQMQVPPGTPGAPCAQNTTQTIDNSKPVFYATGPAPPPGQPCAVPPAQPGALQPSAMWHPEHQKCTPMCKWECTRPECEQSCKPICKPPKCQTRCSGYNISNCHMECATPHCAVICPEKGCPNGDCPLCTTQCTEACCKMQCDAGAQPCQNICEQPECDWECHAPQNCPQPSCSLRCEAPTGCKGSIHQTLPPLSPGSCAVSSFVPQQAYGTALIQDKHMVTSEAGSKVRVPLEIKKEGEKESSVVSLDLPVAPLNAKAFKEAKKIE